MLLRARRDALIVVGPCPMYASALARGPSPSARGCPGRTSGQPCTCAANSQSYYSRTTLHPPTRVKAASWNAPSQNRPTASLCETSGLAKPASPTDIGARIKSHSSSRAIRVLLEGGGGHTRTPTSNGWGRTDHPSLKCSCPHSKSPFNLLLGARNFTKKNAPRAVRT